jgi:hypothetical protein
VNHEENKNCFTLKKSIHIECLVKCFDHDPMATDFFNTESIGRTGPVSFSTIDCVYQMQTTFLADCRTATKAASRPPTRMASPRPTRTTSHTPTKTASPKPTRTASRTPIQTENPTPSQLRCLEAGDPVAVGSCCEKAPDTNGCPGLLPGCMSLALKRGILGGLDKRTRLTGDVQGLLQCRLQQTGMV